MEGLDLDTVAQVVSVFGGLVALMLAAVEIADTWLDIGEKIRKRRKAGKKNRKSG